VTGGDDRVGVGLVNGFVRLKIVVVENDVRQGWDEVGDVGLLDDSSWFPVEWDVDDRFEDLRTRIDGGE